jgi:hypothetical protein
MGIVMRRSLTGADSLSITSDHGFLQISAKDLEYYEAYHPRQSMLATFLRPSEVVQQELLENLSLPKTEFYTLTVLGAE